MRFSFFLQIERQVKQTLEGARDTDVFHLSNFNEARQTVNTRNVFRP